MPSRTALMALLVAGALCGCASAKGGQESRNSDLLTREEIIGTGATNMYDVVNRLRPQWLTVRTISSFTLSDEIVVFQNDMQLGGPEALRQLVPELAYEVRWMDGIRASSMLPGLMSGRHVLGAIIVSTRPPGGS
ncbi:MAG: hypothetical protein ACYC6F_06720 [Longimicrobiales bacterium]